MWTCLYIVKNWLPLSLWGAERMWSVLWFWTVCLFLSVLKCDYGMALFLSLSILVTEWSLFEVGVQFVFVQQANVMAKPWEPGCLQLTAGHMLLFLTIQSPFSVLVHGSSRPSLIITGLQYMGCIRCNSDYTVWIARISIVMLITLSHLKSPLLEVKSIQVWPSSHNWARLYM